MKIILMVGYPLVLLTLFFLLVFEGASFGGFYVVYMLLGLKNSAPFSLWAATGTGMVLGSFLASQHGDRPWKSFVAILGIVLMVVSLFLFYESVTDAGSGKLTLMIFPVCLFGLSGICFLITHVSYVAHKISNSGKGG